MDDMNPNVLWSLNPLQPVRLLRSLGDRCREVLVLCTATEAALDMGAVRQAPCLSHHDHRPHVTSCDHILNVF